MSLPQTRAGWSPSHMPPTSDTSRLREVTQAFRKLELELRSRVAILERENRMLRAAEVRPVKAAEMPATCYKPVTAPKPLRLPQVELALAPAVKRKRRRLLDPARAMVGAP